jgi:hypothetical protein
MVTVHPLSRQRLQKCLDGDDLVALATCAFLTQDKATGRGKGADQVDGRIFAITRTVLPSSTIITPSTTPTSPAIQLRKPYSKTLASNSLNTRPKVSCEGVPCASVRYGFNQGSLSSTHISTISPQVFAPHNTAHCLSKRIPTAEILLYEIQANIRERNAKALPVKWRFSA